MYRRLQQAQNSQESIENRIGEFTLLGSKPSTKPWYLNCSPSIKTDIQTKTMELIVQKILYTPTPTFLCVILEGPSPSYISSYSLLLPKVQDYQLGSYLLMTGVWKTEHQHTNAKWLSTPHCTQNHLKTDQRPKTTKQIRKILVSVFMILILANGLLNRTSETWDTKEYTLDFTHIEICFHQITLSRN